MGKKDYTTSKPGKIVIYGFAGIGLIGGLCLDLYLRDGVDSKRIHNPVILMGGAVGFTVGYLLVIFFGILADKLHSRSK